MIAIRPVSDLRNIFPEVEETVMHSGKPVFLTKNGYGTMVLLSLEQYAALTEDVEAKKDHADGFYPSTWSFLLLRLRRCRLKIYLFS